MAAALACVLGVLGPAAAKAADVPADGNLSPDLAKLAQPSFRSLSHQAQAEQLDVAPSGPGSLVREDGRVLVNVGFEAEALGHLPELQAAGADVVAASGRYQTVTAMVAPDDLRSIASVPGVGSVTESLAPVLHAAGGCEGGSVISEGVNQLGLTAARDAFGLRGAGVTVGVLSDSYDRATEQAFGGGAVATHAKEDIKSNDLPGPAGTCSGQQLGVDVLDDAAPSTYVRLTDEGRGMLQIVHDVAPHASLAFATAFSGETAFAQNIERLAKPVSEGGAGARVIVDDVSYLEEPFFQEGPIANAIAKVTSEGVTYLTAAGNENIFSEGHEIASWEAPEFRDAASCPAAVQVKTAGKGPHCMDFNPAAGEDNGFNFTVKKESEVKVDLQWAEPWSGVSADLDAYLLVGGAIVASAEGNNIGGKPVELLAWTNSKSFSQEVELVINRCTGLCNESANPTAKPRLKFILMGGVTKSQYQVSSGGDVVGPTIYGHAAAASAITLGAVPFNNSTKPETYSSRGPAKHFFGPVSGSTPATEIAEVIQKPNVVATDCGATTFFAQYEAGTWRFCGTSAAAPHAAGVAALMVQGAGATPAQVAAGLESSALAVGSYGSNAVGSGLISAKGALEAVAATPTSADGPSSSVPPLEEVENEPEPEPEPEKPGTGTLPSSLPASESIAVAPQTGFSRHPKKVVKTRRSRARVVFGFAASQPKSTFLCQFDGSAYAACRATVARWFGLGGHVVRVRARGSDGVLDRTPAAFRFKVVRTR